MDNGVTEEGDDECSDHNDDNSYSEWKATARDSCEQLTSHDTANNGKSNIDNDIEKTAKFGSPDAEGVTRDSNLSKAGRRAEGRCESRDQSSDQRRKDSQDDRDVD